MQAKNKNLKQRTKLFTLTALRCFEKLAYKNTYVAIYNQLTKCSTSVGANYRAASRTKSSTDFINKLNVVKKKYSEAMYFPEILIELNSNDKTQFFKIHSEANELISISVACIKTAGKNNS